jgi:integrase
MVPVSVVQALETVDGLRAGRTEARESKGVGPVAIEHVEAALPFMPRAVAAMVKIQLASGCRAGEIVRMRGCELTPGEPTWEYRPARHKSGWRGKGRVVLLGPKAVEVVREFLKPDLAEYLFSPGGTVKELHAKRRAARLSKPAPSEMARRSKGSPGQKHAGRYDTNTYSAAVRRACDKAGVPRWSPLRLRHTAATQIRAKYGLEAAQTVLGHTRADVTQIYAERDIAPKQA